MNFHVSTELFSGPLQLLLEIIEKRDLEITSVALADVTDDYLKHLDSNDVPPEELADFLAIAARLIYLKSAAIVPMPPEDEVDGQALASQLKLYREFVQATELIDARLKSKERSFLRPANKTVMKKEGGPIFPIGIIPSILHESFDRLLKRLQPFFALQKHALERVASVHERIKEIQDVLLSKASLNFSDVARRAKSRVDVVVSFLALLELIKQRTVRVVQSNAFGEIQMKRID